MTKTENTSECRKAAKLIYESELLGNTANEQPEVIVDCRVQLLGHLLHLLDMARTLLTNCLPCWFAPISKVPERGSRTAKLYSL
jgi:hypothetical protein